MPSIANLLEKIFFRPVVLLSIVKFVVGTIWSLLDTHYLWKWCYLPFDEYAQTCSNDNAPYNTYCYGCRSADKSNPFITGCSGNNPEGGYHEDAGQSYGCNSEGFQSSGVASCSAWADSTCICNLWLTFNPLFIGINLLHLVLQLFFLFRYDEFDPQSRQSRIIRKIRSGTASKEEVYHLLDPRYVIWAALQVGSIICVLNLQIFSALPIGCGDDSIQLSNLALPVVIMYLEIGNANLLFAMEQLLKKKNLSKAIFYAVRVDLWFLSLFVMVGQSIIFAFSLIFIFPFFVFKCTEDDFFLRSVEDDDDDSPTTPNSSSKKVPGSKVNPETSKPYLKVNAGEGIEMTL
jgi:hypothetical protein